MEQTSKLGIVVDTTKAASQIKAFSASLKKMEQDGLSASKAILKVGSGANFSALNSSINTARASLSGFNATTNNMTVAMNQAAKAAASLRAATKGISANLNAIASASSKISNISSGIDKARISSGKLGTVIRDINKNILTLNSSLNTGTAALNRFSQASITAGQRLNIFGQAATQTQTRIRGLDTGLAAARNSMSQMASAANSINSIFGNLNNTMARLATATNALNTATTRANAAIHQLGGNANQANAQARGLMGTLSGLQGVLSGGLFAITGLGVLKTADEMQNLNSQVKLVTNSTSEFLGVREKVREIADKNFNDISATTNLYQKSATALANLGKSQQEALIFTDAVSLAMRTGGRSAQEQASAILQLGQAMGSGVLMGDEFRSIAENAPILLELVSKRLGVLPGQLKKLASDGEITSEIMYDAFSQNIGILEEMAKKMPLTMSQAFVVTKNNYKKYVDGIMNDTDGASSKIAGFITGISGNFDTLAKVAIAGAGLAFANMALSIGSASTAMAIFNAVASLNPLILIAGGFLAVNSAIFGTNEVLSLSGVIAGDFFEQMGVMIGDANNWWDEFEDTVARVMGNNVDVIADANDQNTKNFLGFYDQTEKGFAGVIQGLSTAVFSFTNIFMSALTVIDNFILNINSALGNLGTGIYNAGQKAKGFFGGEDNSRAYAPYADKNTNILTVYAKKFAEGQDDIRYYLRDTSKRAGPQAKPGTYDPNYSSPLRSGLLKFGVSDALQGGGGVRLKGAAPAPSYLLNNQISNLPMSEVKAAQYQELKEQEAINAAKEERAKAEKERTKEAKKQAKADREAGKGLSNRLVGISGDTGVGNAHLHVQYRDKSRAVSAADLSRFQAGGKKITDYPMTSGYGKRNTGIKGASTNHKGTDFGIPKNTPITTNVAVKSVKTWSDSKGGGYVSTITFEDGVVIDLLHQMPSVMGVDKGSSTGNKSVDSLVSKAENEVLKAAEEARKEQERINKLRLDGMKEYGAKELQLSIENDERIAKIKESQYDAKTEEAYIAQSNERMQRELDVYKKGLDDKVSAFSAYQKTQRDLLKDEYNNDVFGIVTDPDLSRPENSEQLKAAILGAKALNDYKVSLYEQSLEQEKSAMYAFQKTERQILLDEGVARLADAKLKTDELRDYRIEAIGIEEAYKLSVFDTNQNLKMLELKKSHMSEMQYIREKYALEQQLINSSNETPEIKDLQLGALRSQGKDPLKGVLNRIEGTTPESEIDTQYQSDMDALNNANLIELGLLETHKEAKLAIDKSYQDAKRDLELQKQANTVSSLTAMFGLALGETSKGYRGMFAIQQAYDFVQAQSASFTAIAKAWGSAPFPANLPAVATTTLSTGIIPAAISALSPKGFKTGGYTGNMGVNDVAGQVHGQEYVFDAQATKRIGVNNLEAMRSGRAANDSSGGVGDVNITVNVDANGNSSMTGEQSNAMGKRMAEGIKALIVNEVQSMTRPQALLDRQYARR